MAAECESDPKSGGGSGNRPGRDQGDFFFRTRERALSDRLARTSGLPGILSQIPRALGIRKAWKEDGTAAKVFEKTFQEILACQPVSLLAWIRDHEKDVLEKADYIFSVNDYIRFRLTGEAAGEYTVLSGGNLVNLSTCSYDPELLELFGLEEIRGKLPPLKYSANLRRCDPGGSPASGLAEGTPAAAGMFDVDACGLAAGT